MFGYEYICYRKCVNKQEARAMEPCGFSFSSEKVEHYTKDFKHG